MRKPISSRERLDQHLHSPLWGELQNVSFWDVGIAQSMLRSHMRDPQGETDPGSSQQCKEGAQETMDLSWNKVDWGWIWESISSLAGHPGSRVGCQSLFIFIPWDFSGPDWACSWPSWAGGWNGDLRGYFQPDYHTNLQNYICQM